MALGWGGSALQRLRAAHAAGFAQGSEGQCQSIVAAGPGSWPPRWEDQSTMTKALQGVSRTTFAAGAQLAVALLQPAECATLSASVSAAARQIG